MIIERWRNIPSGTGVCVLNPRSAYVRIAVIDDEIYFAFEFELMLDLVRNHKTTKPGADAGNSHLPGRRIAWLPQERFPIGRMAIHLDLVRHLF